ncbi:hypothetical protein BDW62DRAFT_196630 [Aspergillus aurantiobrunneus]
MVEPFSIASGAAGVVSLGLTVCQGFVAYYGPFTAFSSETNNLVTKAKGLSATLELLQSRLKALQNPLNPNLTHELQLVADRIDDCGKELRSLSKALNRCRGYDATALLNNKGWSSARLLYPFRRGTVVALSDMVMGLQSNLEIAIQVLLLAMSNDIQEQNTLSLTVSRSIASNTAAVPTSLQRIEQGQQQLLQLISNIQQSQLTSIDQTVVPPSFQAPGLSPHHRALKESRRSKTGYTNENSCTCGPRKQRFWAFLPSVRSHQFGCPMYFHREVTTLVDRNIAILSRWVAYSASLKVTIVRQTPGFTIHPTLGVRPVVGLDSPAFQIVRDFHPHRETVDSALIKLRSLFEEGKASPKDTLPDGTTLLHLGVRTIFFRPNLDLSTYCHFLESLIQLCHIPVDEQAQGHTVLDCLVRGELAMWLVSLVARRMVTPLVHFAGILMDHGAVVTTDLSMDEVAADDELEPRSTTLAYLFLPTIVRAYGQEEFPFSGIETAVLQRSERNLGRLLGQRNCEGSWHDANISPFILAVAWPQGLSMLLEFCPSRWLPRLLYQAILESQLDSLRILLEVGQCRITPSIVYRAARYHYNPTVFQALAGCLAARRHRLEQQARTHLLPNQLHELGMDRLQGLLDAQACLVEHHLRKVTDDLSQGVPVINDLYSCQRSVYHLVGCNVQAADSLYAVGFATVDQIDMAGRSPLALLRPPILSDHGLGARLTPFLEMCEWFIDKGIPLDTQSSTSPLLPIHTVADGMKDSLSRALRDKWLKSMGPWSAHIEQAIGEVVEEWRMVCARYPKLLQQILGDTQHRDCCVCACSIDGCLPSTIALGRIWTGPGDIPLIHGYIVARLLDGDTLNALHYSLAPVALRSCTFEGLGLRHTCRQHYPRYPINGDIGVDDVAEVQAEEQPLIEQLEELVSEFELKYEELGVPLPEFLMGYWKTRMEKVLAEGFDEGEACRMRGVGVVVQVP